MRPRAGEAAGGGLDRPLHGSERWVDDVDLHRGTHEATRTLLAGIRYGLVIHGDGVPSQGVGGGEAVNRTATARVGGVVSPTPTFTPTPEV